MYLLKQGGYDLPPCKELFFFFGKTMLSAKFSKFSHNWQVLTGLVEPLLDRPSTCAIAQPQKLAH
jgi:hypothetical protein